MASNAPSARNTRRTQQRSNSRATANREMNALIGQVLERLDDMSKQIQAMLPREIYEVRHGQVVSETQELAQRMAIAEKAINELNSRVVTTQLAASQQIASEVRPVEKSITEVRYEALSRSFETFSKAVFFIGGAIVTIGSYVVYRLMH